MIKFLQSLLHISNGHPNCVLVFSSFALRDYGPTAFSFRKHFDHNQDNIDIIYIKDSKNQWYNRRLSGLGVSLDENISCLKASLSAYKNVFCFGSSMGGYAALLFGSALGVDRIISISPQTFLKSPYPRYNYKIHSGNYVDLRNLNFALNNRVDIVTGENCIFDVYQCLKFINLSNFQVHFVKNANHHLIERWSEDQFLTNFAKSICINKSDQFISEANIFSQVSNLKEAIKQNSISLLISEAVDSYYNSNFNDAIKSLLSISSVLPSWAAVSSLLGKAYLRNGDIELAINEFSRIFESDENIDDYLLDFANVLAERGAKDEAIKVAKKALTMNISHRNICKSIAEIFKSKNDYDSSAQCEDLIKQ